MTDINAHNNATQENIANWRRKPLLREIYKDFHKTIASYFSERSLGDVVEVGSGVADITEVIPDCIRTDLFPNPWIDRVENSYKLSFDDGSVSNLILFDVFHHLRHPGAALREFRRVLAPGGRLLIFEPCLSLLGLVVYGLCHKEPIGLRQQIQWEPPANWNPQELDYYAAQGNAMRIFIRREVDVNPLGWNTVTVKQLSSISYIASGGYTRPQMYPGWALPTMQKIDSVLSCMPKVFSTRMLVVLEKTDEAEPSAGGDT